MYITPITNYSFTGSQIRILTASNKDCKYLHLDVLNLSRAEKFGATFHNNVIEIPSPTQKVLEKLKAMNIKYETYKKEG